MIPQPRSTGIDEPPEGASRSLHVLVVDDSAVVRQVMTALLSQEPDFHVTTAPDPIIAIEKMKRARPDVIVLDLEMPRMDGLTFLHKIMTEDPIPVVICSSFTGAGTEAVLLAMEGGRSRSSPSRKWGSGSSSTNRPCCWWTPSGGRRGRAFGRRSDGSDPCSSG